MKRTTNDAGVNRREFLSATAAAACVSLSQGAFGQELPGEKLQPAGMLGKLCKAEGEAPIAGAAWYVAESEGDGLRYAFPAGALAKAKYLAADMLLDGATLVVFSLRLQEGEKGRALRFNFGGLNQCSFRLRMDLALVDQNRWLVEREGALLKPMCGGDRVDLDKVDRITLAVARKSAAPARFCMTGLHAAPAEVPRIEKPILPKGPLIDKFGQSTLHDWPGKTRTEEELKQRVQEQFQSAAKQEWPAGFSRWGGWKAKKIGEATGFFRRHHDGRRWWLVDPDGYAFWSAGVDCVRVDTDARYDGLETALAWLPDPGGEFADMYGARRGRGGKSINFLAANMIRAFGAAGWRDKWAAVALAEIKRLRFNTVGNWSDYEYAGKARFPYVRPLSFRPSRSRLVYRDFPDVYHPEFERDAADYAGQLKDTAADPALVGYFLMNEPTWAFSSELPAAGMLYNMGECASRGELAGFLKRKYTDDAALSAAWKLPAAFDKVAKGKWSGIFSPEALADLREFSARMVERYFGALSRACRQAAPNHLNLGMRWAGIPPAWAVQGMKSFDVFSLNCYQQKLPLEQAEKIHAALGMPVLVGEWHFGALDVGLPASGIGHVKTQADRGRAYRIYLEDAAADPYCVGVHWFTLYDQSALGRFDGENYNIGFLDICNRPYTEMAKAAITSHERMYSIAEGQAKPFQEAPEYLPRVYL